MNHRKALAVGGLTGLLFAACGGGSSDSGGGGGSTSQMDTTSISNGFGLMIPHQIFKPDASGNPTNELVAIRKTSDLLDNVTPSNPVLPTTEWPATAMLPNGAPGNHFVYCEFKQPIDVASVLDSTPSGQANSGLTGTITVVALDPTNGQSVPVRGRAFIGGRTYAGTATGSPPVLALQKWVIADSNGKPIVNPDMTANPQQMGLGFPGTESAAGFQGDSLLTKDNVFVFVVDTDGDLTLHETFPANRQIRIRCTTAVRSTKGKALGRQALGSATVGPDTLKPEVAVTPPPNSHPVTIPSFGSTNVDPLTNISIEFTEPVQPLSVGRLPQGNPPSTSPSIAVTFGPSNKLVTVPFTVLPPSVYDLSSWVITPGFNFPGSGPNLFQCGTFNTISVNVTPNQLADLPGNQNSRPADTHFDTGPGPGLVNAPVTPDAIYMTRLGATPGMSVIDLNGFGQSTGNPTFSPTVFAEGNSNFPNNPNIVQGSVLRPPISPGSCTIDGGSSGVFTLTEDSSLNNLLLRSPTVTSVGDMALGNALDVVFNNAQEATGCQAGGGNICAIRGKKNIQLLVSSSSALQTTTLIPANLPNLPGTGLGNFVIGAGNPVCWGPHPNPPPMVFPPLCVSPFIASQETTSFEVIQLPPPNSAFGLGRSNLLGPGDPFGNPFIHLAPSGLLTKQQNCFFEGPSPIRDLAVCVDYMYRQQVGHFLYVIDRARRELVVLNSNRFNVLDRISLPDPTDLAMGPNLDFLAVSNQNADSVSFIDVTPTSATFHQVVKTLNVGRGPRGIAWDPGNEDILCCNEQESTVSVISVAQLAVRKTISSQINHPFDVCIQQRQFNFGFFRNVYLAFILNRTGDLAVFESGPNGVNGWGYDDIVGVPAFNFQNPKKIMLDYNKLGGSCWIVHENQLTLSGAQTNLPGGAVTNIVIDSATSGQLPLNVNSLFIPQFRDMNFKVNVSIGPDQLTGIPVDMALDDLINLGGLENVSTVQSAGTPVILNGKSSVKAVGLNVITGAKNPQFMFLAVPNSTEGPGVVDVIDVGSPGFRRIDTNAFHAGVQSIPASGVNGLMDYWRQ